MKIIPRGKWGARYASAYRNYDAPLPASEVWLHHSVTLAPDLEWIDANRDGVDDDERAAMRALEQIGQNRFGWGISYTWPIMPSGRIYQGHRVDGVGTHTANRNSTARAICFVGNYDKHKPTDAQLDAAAWLLVHAKAKGWIKSARLNGGHRDLKATACPGKYAYAQISEINRRAAAIENGDDMPTAKEVAEAVRDLPADPKRPKGPTIGQVIRSTFAVGVDAKWTDRRIEDKIDELLAEDEAAS